jgi:hemerythrin
MALFEWTPALSVGVTEMDNQHKKLIDLINRLNDAMKAGKGKDILAQVFKELADYTIFHFGAEEKYMQQFSYPEIFKQKAEHKVFIDKTLAMTKDLIAGKITVSMDVMTFLKDWLSKHIQGEDKKYGSLFNQKGMK